MRALTSFAVYMRFGLDVRDDDVYWNIADPGWAYGLFYALVGPLLLRLPTLFVNAPFTVYGTLNAMRAYSVTNFAAAATVYSPSWPVIPASRASTTSGMPRKRLSG